MQGRSVPITEGEFVRFCDLHDAGTFMAQRGLWQKMEKNIVGVLSGGPVHIDEITEMKMMHAANKRTAALREHEFGGHGNVRDTVGFFRVIARQRR